VKSEKQLNAEILAAVNYVILCPEDYGNAEHIIHNAQSKFYLSLPVVAMSEDIKVLRRILGNEKIKGIFAGIVANNVYALKLADEYGYKVFKGPMLNTINDNFCDYENIILSPELTENEYRLFKDWDKKNYFLCVYGYLPLMTLAHCPYKGTAVRQRCEDKKCTAAALQFKDELNNLMSFRRTKISKCYFELLNSTPLNLLNYKNKIKPHFFFDMREAGKSEIAAILAQFKEPGNKAPGGKYTAGLYFKELV
jgi:hypothetical protein